MTIKLPIQDTNFEYCILESGPVRRMQAKFEFTALKEWWDENTFGEKFNEKQHRVYVSYKELIAKGVEKYCDYPTEGYREGQFSPDDETLGVELSDRIASEFPNQRVVAVIDVAPKRGLFRANPEGIRKAVKPYVSAIVEHAIQQAKQTYNLGETIQTPKEDILNVHDAVNSISAQRYMRGVAR